MPAYFAKPSWPIWQPGQAPTGCKLYLPFAERSGLTARNLAGGGSDAALTGSVWVTSEYGSALAFNATATFARIGNMPAVQITGALTLAILIRAGTGTQINKGIVGKYDSLVNQRGWMLATDPTVGTKPQWIYQSSAVSFNAAQQLSGATAINDSNWHVVAAVFIPSLSASIYLDGRLDATTTSSVPASIAANTAAFEIGRNNGSGGFSGAWAGRVGAVALFSRALGADEVAALSSDWLSGQFSAVRPRSSLAVLAATMSPAATFQAAWATSSNQFTGGGY